MDDSFSQTPESAGSVARKCPERRADIGHSSPLSGIQHRLALTRCAGLGEVADHHQ